MAPKIQQRGKDGEGYGAGREPIVELEEDNEEFDDTEKDARELRLGAADWIDTPDLVWGLLTSW